MEHHLIKRHVTEISIDPSSQFEYEKGKPENEEVNDYLPPGISLPENLFWKSVFIIREKMCCIGIHRQVFCFAINRNGQ